MRSELLSTASAQPISSTYEVRVTIYYYGPFSDLLEEYSKDLRDILPEFLLTHTFIRFWEIEHDALVEMVWVSVPSQHRTMQVIGDQHTVH